MNGLFRKSMVVTAFDIQGEFVKVAQVAIRDNERLLQKLLILNSPSPKPEDISKTVFNLIRQINLSDSAVIVNLPRHMVTVREMKMPAVTTDELEGMISLQVPKFLPYSKEDIVYGYKILESTAEGYSRVMLVMTQREAIEKILYPFRQCGIEVHRIALSSEGLTSWYLSRQAATDSTQTVALIDIDYACAGLQILRGDTLEFTRAITFSPDEKLKRLIEEIGRSFLIYKKQSQQDITRLVLTGAESTITSEAPAIKKEFNLPTVYINPVESWPRALDAKLPEGEEGKKFSFATILAVAFNFDRLQLNLLPSEIKKAKAEKIAKETILVTCILALCIFLSFVGIIWKKMSDKTRYLRYINSEISKANPEVEKLSKMINNIKNIKQQMDMRGSGVDVIREFYKLIPDDISLTILDFEEGAQCTIRGTASELSSVFKFIPILENSAYFNNVKIRYSTIREVRGQSLADFEITCNIAVSAEIPEGK